VDKVEILNGTEAYNGPRPGAVNWTRDETGLTIELPERRPSEHALAFRITSVK
jgi:hypothetical protein